ncbi:MAG: ribulose-phosphate 3-epimerase [Myxococcota bacterium]|nr:ribulose-phosphate 3-epimerase [Myxococcota bacterium]
MKIKIAPSILSADFGNLASEIQSVAQAGADWIHIDVMDGRFVPNITIGPLIVAAARAATDLPLDVHLMIADPDQYIGAFADAGADVITVHAEACTHLHRSLQMIRDLNKRAGVAINPATPVNAITHVLDVSDLVLIMSVNPGFGGQVFIADALQKIQQTAALIKDRGRDIALEVDGGIDPTTSGQVMAAGADVLVAGSAVFKKDNYQSAIKAIRRGDKDISGRRGNPA